MIFQLHTGKDLAQIESDLRDAAAKHKFGVIAVHDLKETMRNKGVELALECRIFEVCNPVQAKKVLESDGAVSTMLPCRISAYGTAGDYTLATILPTEMMKAFGRPEIETVAQEVENVVVAIMRETVGQ